MKTACRLKKGSDTFTLRDLIQKAAARKGLKLQEVDSYGKGRSKSIKTYTLDEKRLSFLAKRGIQQQERPDCRNEIFTLVDENPQKKVPGFTPSSWWNFKRRKGGEIVCKPLLSMWAQEIACCVLRAASTRSASETWSSSVGGVSTR